MMKILKSLSSLCVRNYCFVSKNLLKTRINSQMLQESSNLFYNESRRQICRQATACGKEWSYSKAESDSGSESRKLLKYESIEDRNKRKINEWYEQLCENLQYYNDLQIDWGKEVHGFNWHLSMLAKITSEKKYIKGLYEIAESLMTYVDSMVEEGTLKMRNKDIIYLISRVTLCVFQKLDQDQALKYYKELCKKLTIDGELLMDFNSCHLLIPALSKTNAWRECLKLLEISKITNNCNTTMCSVILAAALRENDERVVNEMIASIDSRNDIPNEIAFQALTEHKPFWYLMDVLSKNRWIIDEISADVIKTNHEKTASVEKVQLHKSDCPCCNNSIFPGQRISQNEMDSLKSTFSRNVFIRENNVFLNSDPEEINKFMEFMNSAPKFDIVLDSLNIFYMAKSISVQQRDKVLGDTIRYFSNMGKNILVLSKEHHQAMLKYCKQFIRPDYPVDWFFAKNQSNDDLFMLYACLHGNEGCQMVTRDELRNHGFQLGSEVRRIFKRWQEKHQVVYRGFNPKTNKVLLQWPQRHEVIAQTSKDGTVHIPYKDEKTEQLTFTHSNSWLCIRGLDSSNKPSHFHNTKSNRKKSFVSAKK